MPSREYASSSVATWTRSRRRALILVSAALLFVAVFVSRLADTDSADPITLLYCVPIAIVSIEFGLTWGLAAAALSLGLYGVWDAVWSEGGASALAYLTRGATFLFIATLTGQLGDRLRRIAQESDRFFQLASDLHCTAGFDGYFKRLNPAWEQTLGWSRAELLSRPFLEFVHADDRERTASEAARLVESPTETISFRNRYRAADGSYRWLEWNAKTVAGEDLIYGIARDITAQKEAEDLLERSESFLDSVLENLPSMVFVKDAEELRFVRFNRAGEEMLGFSRQELIGRNDYDLFPPEQAEFFTAKDREVLASDEVLDIPEEPVETKAGERRILHTRKVAIRDEDGNPLYLLGISEDITELQVLATEILDTANEAVVSMDADGLIVGWNAQAERTFGWSREEAVGRSLADTIIPPRYREAHADGLQRFLTTGEGPVLNMRLELAALHRDGHEFPVELTISAVRRGDRYLFSAFLHDISESKRAEAETQAATEEAERANQAKSEFLSRMSHELRTPLNSILGFGQLLEMDGLEPAQREGVAQILKGGRHLLALIDEVLDIARIESGNMGISLEPVHLGSVLAEALSLIAPLASEAGVRLEGDPSELEQWYVRADQQRLKQVLLNLLSNGVKYNRRDGVVSVECRRPAEDRIEITVADSGPGMSPEQLEQLFEPFERLGAEHTAVEGTGLGLALSKALVEAMGGTIVASSEPGRGTTFAVELERAEPQADEQAPSGPAAAAVDGEVTRRTVVYVEDNLSNLKLVEGTLARLPDVRLIPAIQGKLALDLIREHRPNLVLLDLHLPDLPGAQVLEKLQMDPATRDIPVVVVSADATASQIERLRAAGASDYLTKPLDVRRLLELVAAPSDRG